MGFSVFLCATDCCIRAGLAFFANCHQTTLFSVPAPSVSHANVFCIHRHFQCSVWPLRICRFNLKTAFTFLCKSCRNLQLCKCNAFLYPYPCNPWYQIVILLTLLLDGFYTLQPMSNIIHAACHLRIQVSFFKILLLILTWHDFAVILSLCACPMVCVHMEHVGEVHSGITLNVPIAHVVFQQASSGSLSFLCFFATHHFSDVAYM